MTDYTELDALRERHQVAVGMLYRCKDLTEAISVWGLRDYCQCDNKGKPCDRCVLNIWLEKVRADLGILTNAVK